MKVAATIIIAVPTGSSCPHCGAPVNRATSVSGPERGLQPGDLAICSCRTILRFGEGLKLELLSPEALAGLPRTILSELFQAVGEAVKPGSPRNEIILDIGDAERNRAQELVAFAKEHPFRKGSVPPRDPRFCAVFPAGFRVIHSLTEGEGSGALYRHMTITHESGVWPDPEQVQAIGALLGFQGHVSSWLVALESSPGCTRRACPCHRVVALQPVGDAGLVAPAGPAINVHGVRGQA